MTMMRPSGADLWREYLKFDGDRQPCKRPGIVNQCAVRMSVALGRCNCKFDFHQWTLGFVHDKAGVCRDLPPHVTNASNLVRYIESQGLHFEIYQKSTTLSAEAIKQRVRGRTGIIYFQHCFGTHGSHVDFWDGKEFMNQLLRVSAGGDLPSGSDLFVRAQGVIKFSPTP